MGGCRCEPSSPFCTDEGTRVIEQPSTEVPSENLWRSLEEPLDRMLAWWETAKGKEGSKERLDSARAQLAEQLEAECERGARAAAAGVVASPFPTERPGIEEWLELERKAAIGALRDAILEPLTKRVEERLAGIDD